jgi:hypothetical protein
MPKAKLDPKSLELLRRSEAENEKSLIACHHADLISKRLASTLKRNDALIQSSGNLADFQTLHPSQWLNKPNIK